jgi:hypothetical protein
MDARDELLRRAAERSSWPVQRYSLGSERDDLVEVSATERIAMMWPLALEAWELGGLSIPEYTRANIPSRILRGPTE